MILAFLILLPIGIYANHTLGGAVIGSEDSILVMVPWLEHLARSLKQYQVPLWNPYFFGGQTFVGVQSSPLFYPFNYLVGLMSCDRYVVWSSVLHTSLGYVGHWYLGRAWGMSRLGALVAALFLGTSAGVYMEFERFQIPQVMGWLPWFLLALERGLPGRARYLGLAGLVLGIQFACNHFQFIQLELLVVGVLWFFHWGPQRGHAKTLAALMLVGGIAALLAMPIFLCLIDYVSHNVRSYATPIYFRVYSPKLKDLGQIFFSQRDLHGLLYTVPTLASRLALLSLGLPARPRNLVVAFWAMGLLGLFLAFAGGTRLEALANWVPLYASLRYRYRYVLLTIFGVGWLAALAFDGLSERLRQRAPLWRAVGVALVALQCIPRAAFFNIPHRVEDLRRLPALQLLEGKPGFYRILTLPYVPMIYWNWGIAAGYRNLCGFNGSGDLAVQKVLHWAELGLELSKETMGATLDRNLIRLHLPLDAPILRIFSVRYALYSDAPRRSVKIREAAWPVAPHAYLCGQVRQVSERQALELMSAADFDPTRLALMTSTPPAVAAQAEPIPCRTFEASSDHLVVEVPAHQEHRLLVLSEVYDADWEASLEGKPLPIVPVDLALRGVALPPGQQVVEFRYRPRGLRRGLPFTLLGLMLALGLIVWKGPKS